jgi:hypothetical protein
MMIRFIVCPVYTGESTTKRKMAAYVPHKDSKRNGFRPLLSDKLPSRELEKNSKKALYSTLKKIFPNLSN